MIYLNKPKARILDAGCGNRTMWKIKDSPFILYIDKEAELSYSPDKRLDVTDTGLKDQSFHTVFFDPPHEYGRTLNTSLYTTPNRETANDKWPKWARKGHPRYYGADKCKTARELKIYLANANRELWRITQDNGCLWLKWSENKLDLNEVLNLMTWWEEYLRIPIKTVSENATPSYWAMFMKRLAPWKQQAL